MINIKANKISSDLSHFRNLNGWKLTILKIKNSTGADGVLRKYTPLTGAYIRNIVFTKL